MLEAAPRAKPGALSVAASQEGDPRDQVQDQDQDQGQASMFEVNQLGEDRRLVSRVESSRGEARRDEARRDETRGPELRTMVAPC